jgi:K+-sensing histidine kinase KdpD
MNQEQSVASRILEAVNDVQADLIVIGTNGREGYDKLLHGHVVHLVAGSADFPVRIVPLHQRNRDCFADRWRCTFEPSIAGVHGKTFRDAKYRVGLVLGKPSFDLQ